MFNDITAYIIKVSHQYYAIRLGSYSGRQQRLGQIGVTVDDLVNSSIDPCLPILD